jgi:NAD(P)-dependent dehydrogenase (short-subunit alcohol dehydrogenase family)
MTFDGKVAVVTGGSSGIGKECAIRLATGGSNVVIIGRQLDALEQARKDILAQTKKSVMTVQCDVSDAAAISAMVDKVLAEQGKIDILVNNAGFSLLKPLLETTEKEWDDLQAINLKGAWLCTKAVVPNMVQRREGGRIIKR